MLWEEAKDEKEREAKFELIFFPVTFPTGEKKFLVSWWIDFIWILVKLESMSFWSLRMRIIPERSVRGRIARKQNTAKPKFINFSWWELKWNIHIYAREVHLEYAICMLQEHPHPLFLWNNDLSKENQKQYNGKFGQLVSPKSERRLLDKGRNRSCERLVRKE